jgi:hypothetical protein
MNEKQEIWAWSLLISAVIEGSKFIGNSNKENKSVYNSNTVIDIAKNIEKELSKKK